MGLFSGLFRSRDKPKDSYDSPSYTYFFGRTHAGKRVNDRTALQQIAVYIETPQLVQYLKERNLYVNEIIETEEEM